MRHAFYFVLLPLLAFSLFSCAALPSALAPSARSAADRLDLAEAVFRYQFEHNASGSQKNCDYFFICIEREDPSPELLRRFADNKPKVVPASDATSSGRGVSHKTLGGTGLLFTISDITWLNDNTADVDGGYYEANLSSSGNTYRVERRDGKWIVTKNTMHWIS
ncbi:MAG: hypothetical protein FWD61_13380 [Phycisphaerales bacterium]|nr:hypothetical protein [Phycisphaerales bacterium]